MDTVKFTLIFCSIFIYRPTFGENLKNHATETLYNYHIDLDSAGNPKRLACPGLTPLDDLKDECSILQVFNQTKVDLMRPEYLRWLAETCACQLMSLNQRWERSYDSDQLTREVAHLVRVRTSETLNEGLGYPVYFWTDVELISYRVSVYTSMRDYFHKMQTSREYRIEREWRPILEKDPKWTKIGVVCKKISRDPNFVFRYLENLARLDPSAFFRLVLNDDVINQVYQASKACKMLLLLKLSKYKLRPDDTTVVVANRADGETDGFNTIDDSHSGTRDIETLIYQAKSLMPHNCNRFSSDKTDAPGCPIQFDQGDTGDNVKIWLAQNVTAFAVRSMAAVQCGCQMLLHNSTWNTMLKDPDVALMAKAVTSYLNENRVPDVASSPSWVLHGWFKETMWNLSKSRKGPIREIIKIRQGGKEDPTEASNRDSGAEALDLLRRGCLMVVLNYDPATRRKGRFRLVQYLDELQTISPDPMYVFQLTLQDINLFKIYALSKMCDPIM